MKLIDLNPRWVGAGGEGVFRADGTPAPERRGVGISFDCPCGKAHEGPSRVYVHIDPPFDGGPPIDTPDHVWKRQGETFFELTLTPSLQRIGGCLWHGAVSNGEVKTY
jgi:hypothetical protein